MWGRVIKYFDKGHLMGCANHGNAATTGHIEAHHAYSILGVYEVPGAQSRLEWNITRLEWRRIWRRRDLAPLTQGLLRLY